jgi:hypothetical protein
MERKTMLVQVTTAGAQKLKAGELILPVFKLGNGYGYDPTEATANLSGTIVHSGTPVGPIVATSTLLRYSATLDYEVGPFSYGEIGLFSADGTLVAIAVADELITKDANSNASVGESQRVDLYVAVLGETIAAWADTAESSNAFKLAILQTVDSLPSALAALPNAYLISPIDESQDSFLAYTDREGVWNFDCYSQKSAAESYPVLEASQVSLHISRNEWVNDYAPTYPGKTILQFLTGEHQGICRYVDTATVSVDGTRMVLGLRSSLTVAPNPGDKIRLVCRDALRTTNIVLPVASQGELGTVKVGPTLLINDQGEINVNPDTERVHSVAGRIGDVTLSAGDVSGLAQVATSGSYNHLSDLPEPLQPATTTKLGGVKVDATFLQIAADGTLTLNYNPVKSVNAHIPGANGDVTIIPDFKSSSFEGNFSSLVEYRWTVENPTQSEYVLGDLNLTKFCAGELTLVVKEVAPSYEGGQFSKLSFTQFGNFCNYNEHSVNYKDHRFPFYINSTGSLVVKASDVSYKDSYISSVGSLNLASLAISPMGKLRSCGRQYNDPLKVISCSQAAGEGLDSLKASEFGEGWSLDSLVYAGLPILNAAYGNGIWFGFTRSEFVKSYNGTSWEVVSETNPIKDWMISSGAQLNTLDALVFDTEAARFVFVDPVVGITYETTDGTAWTTRSTQLPLTFNSVAVKTDTLTYGRGIGFYCLSGETSPRLLHLLGAAWVVVATTTQPVLAASYHEVGECWLWLQRGIENPNSYEVGVVTKSGEVSVTPLLAGDTWNTEGAGGFFSILPTRSNMQVGTFHVFAYKSLTVGVVNIQQEPTATELRISAMAQLILR